MSSVTDADRAPAGPDPLPGELGRGSWGRTTVVLHRLLAITAAFVLACLPVMASTVLASSALTTVLGVLLLGAVAAALSAALAAWDSEGRAVHPQPWTAYWRGYRRNAVDVLRVVLPALLVGAVIAVSVADLGGAGVGSGYGLLLIILAAVVAIVATRSVIIASFFSFRTRDVWRLACFTLFRKPAATIALIALLVCAIGVVWLLGEAVLVLLGGIAARLLLHYERGVIGLVRDEFTHEGQATTP